MTSRHRTAFVTLAAAAVVSGAACNALTGVGDLSVCQGAACHEAPLDGGGTTSSAGDATTPEAAPGVPVPDCLSERPPTARCDGNAVAACSGAAIITTPCAETCADAVCVPWPSCRAEGLKCGLDGGSCCESAAVPGGTFERRNEADKIATVSPFALDTHEVTVGRFRAFVTAGAGTRAMPPIDGSGAHPKIVGSGWQASWNAELPPNTDGLRVMLSGSTWTDAAGPNERKPIANVSWFVAFAFCAWDGARLPTYSEWDFAAAGGSEQRIFPWSSPPDSTTITASNASFNCAFAAPPYTCPASICSLGAISPCDATACVADGGTCSTPPCFGCELAKDLPDVGSLPLGRARWGHFDLGGGVAEIVLDARPKNAGDSFPVPCNDCAPTMGANPRNDSPGANDDYEYYVVNGAWDAAGDSLVTTSWRAEKFNARSSSVGFRCARDRQ